MDNFETFLNLDDVTTNSRSNNFSDATLQMLDESRAQLAAEKAAEQEELAIDVEEDEVDDFFYDFSDITDDFLFSDEEGFTDPEAEEEQEEASEEINQDQEAGEESTEEAPQYQEFEFTPDTVITLPSGETISYGDLEDYLEDNTRLTARDIAIAQREQELEDRISKMGQALNVSRTENELDLAQYEGVDWPTLYAQDPQSYAAHRNQYDLLIKRQNELAEAIHAQNERDRILKEQQNATQASYCVEELKKEIPNWDQPLYQQLMQYAIDLGASEAEILDCRSPFVFKSLHRAYQRDLGIKARRAVKAKQPSAVVSGGSADSATGITQNQRQREAAKKYASGKMSQEEAFMYLED